MVLPSSNYKLWASVPRQGWWVCKKILEAQRPEDLQKRKQRWPGQAHGTAVELLSACQPLPHSLRGGSQKGKCGPRTIQAAEPAAERGRVRDAIGVFDRRCRRLPRTMLQKVSPQCLTAGDRAVMGMGQGETRKEGEGQPAQFADAAVHLDPVVTLVMRLFAPPAVTDYRIAQTLRTAAKNQLCAGRRPVQDRVAMIRTKWDKENRTAWEALPLSGPFQGSAPRREPSSPSCTLSTQERITQSSLPFSSGWPVKRLTKPDRRENERSFPEKREGIIWVRVPTLETGRGQRRSGLASAEENICRRAPKRKTPQL